MMSVPPLTDQDAEANCRKTQDRSSSIRDGQTLIINGGSTTHYFAQGLGSKTGIPAATERYNKQKYESAVQLQHWVRTKVVTTA
jgi:DeoR/GlpR family transcriptional regulator of sugar metabolism